ncbi:MAG: M48 family metallopeptidase [Bacteroidota bacterium]|nr:M48 family metallopeptidase [Bacteroidota bacterium]
MKLTKTISYLFVLAWLAGIFLQCKTVPVTNRKELNLVPEFLIKSMSFTEYDSVIRVSRTLPAGNEQTQLIRRVGARIQKAVEDYMNQNGFSKELKNYKWDYNVIDENIINAWCMPGGKVVVYTGLLPVTQNETALAIVMGHEIGHAIAHHGNERMSQALLIQLGGLTLEEALKQKSQQTQAIFLSLYMIGANLGFALPHSRLQESEADKLGLIFAAMAGYDPEEAIPFWKRMAASGTGNKIPEFLSTHPSDETRIKKLSALIPEVKQKYYKQ